MAKEKDIMEKAEKLGLSKESVEAGLKKNKTPTETAINKAYKFKFGGK